MSLDAAFNSLLLLAPRRTVTITRPGGSTATVHIIPSNYFRNLAAPSDLTIEGREFVVSYTEVKTLFGTPKKGDRLTDSDMGVLVISEVREMFGLGNAILGYRIRTS